VDTDAIIRCRPVRQDREAVRDAFARARQERERSATRLGTLLAQRQRIVLTGTAADLVNNAIAVQSARETAELLDATFGALAECDRNIAADA